MSKIIPPIFYEKYDKLEMRDTGNREGILIKKNWYTKVKISSSIHKTFEQSKVIEVGNYILQKFFDDQNIIYYQINPNKVAYLKTDQYTGAYHIYLKFISINKYNDKSLLLFIHEALHYQSNRNENGVIGFNTIYNGTYLNEGFTQFFVKKIYTKYQEEFDCEQKEISIEKKDSAKGFLQQIYYEAKIAVELIVKGIVLHKVKTENLNPKMIENIANEIESELFTSYIHSQLIDLKIIDSIFGKGTLFNLYSLSASDANADSYLYYLFEEILYPKIHELEKSIGLPLTAPILHSPDHLVYYSPASAPQTDQSA